MLYPIILSRCKALESTSFVAWRVVTSLHWERDKGSCSDVRELFLISFSHSLRQNVTMNTKIVWECCNKDSQLDPVEWCLYTIHRCFWQAKVKSISRTRAGEMSNTQTWSFLESTVLDELMCVWQLRKFYFATSSAINISLETCTGCGESTTRNVIHNSLEVSVPFSSQMFNSASVPEFGTGDRVAMAVWVIVVKARQWGVRGYRIHKLNKIGKKQKATMFP